MGTVPTVTVGLSTNKIVCFTESDHGTIADAHHTGCMCVSCSPAVQPPRGTPPPPLKIDGNRLVRQDNWEQVKLRGINWFGFNVARTAVDGLGMGDSDVVGDFETIVYQLK